MQTLTTRTGKVFNVIWCGKATVDNTLRFETADNEATLTEAFVIFNDKNETSVLTHVFDEKTTVYEGYAVIRSIEQLGARIAIALKQEV